MPYSNNNNVMELLPEKTIFNNAIRIFVLILDAITGLIMIVWLMTVSIIAPEFGLSITSGDNLGYILLFLPGFIPLIITLTATVWIFLDHKVIVFTSEGITFKSPRNGNIKKTISARDISRVDVKPARKGITYERVLPEELTYLDLLFKLENGKTTRISPSNYLHWKEGERQRQLTVEIVKYCQDNYDNVNVKGAMIALGMVKIPWGW